MERVMEYIESHVQTGFSEEELAEDLRYHPYYVNRVFKKHTGQTLHNYLLHEKVRMAIAMLRANGRSTTEIAEACGFANSSHFSKVFKRITGVSPTNYRKANTVL